MKQLGRKGLLATLLLAFTMCFCAALWAMPKASPAVAEEAYNNYLAGATPEFSKSGGVYYSDDANGDNVTWGDGSSARLGNVEITTSADGAEIYYTTDGSVPTKDSTKYTGALTFSRGTYRVRAVAYKDGKYSDVSERIYYVGSENYLKGASYSYNEGYAGPTNTVWGTGVDSIDFIVSSVQNGRYAADTAAMSRGDGFTYLQLDMGEAKSVNYLTFCSFWHYGGDLSTKVWLSKIEIGDGENFTTVYQKAEGSGSPLTSSGYVAENAATSNGVVINLAIFLDSAVSGRYIRYYNEGDDLHINYVTAGYYETTPAQMQGQSVPQALSVSSEYDYTKSYETGTTRFEVLTDLVTSYAAINIGGELCEVEWYAPADYDEYYGGVFNFIGVLQNLPSDIVNLYNVALTVEVSLPVKTNPTALKAYIEGLQIGAQGEYTSSTWSDYAQSLAKAQSIISALGNDEAAKTQTEVDDALNELKSDVAALEKLGDKTALNAKIEAVENTDTAPYTEESTAAFTDALSSARAVAASDNVTQAQVDEALQALTSAYEGLAYKADKTTLNGRIEALSAIDLSDKTPETAASFTQALNAARAVSEKADASQNEVDAALSDLNAAYSALTDRANKTALNAKISEAEAEVEKTIYTSATLAALKTALSDAETVAENANASQNEVDNALAQLNEAISALEKLGDRTALKADVSELQANKDKYTQSSWNVFSAETLNALLTVADDADASEKEVAEAAELLRAEIAKLVLRADTAALTEKLNLSLTQSDYTSASWVVYLAARNNALEVIADADALQEDADSALTALTSAIEGLEKLGDKTALNALIAEAKEKAEGKYSAESLAVLENAISDAETIAADSQASESEVEAATVSLQSAIDGLTSSGGCRSGLTPATSLLLFAVLSGFAAALTRRCARREKK